MNFKKEYSLTQKDYFKFNLRNIKRQVIIYSILVAIFAFLIRLFSYDMNTKVLQEFNFWTMYFLFLLIGILVVILYLVTIVYMTSKMVYKNNKELYQNLSFEFDDAGIYQIVNEHKMITKWEEFSKKYLFLGIYCFMISNRQGIIIPKNIFTKEEKEWLNNKIK